MKASVKKIYSGGLVALLAIVVSGFTVNSQSKLEKSIETDLWFFNPPLPTGSIDDAENYTRAKPKDVECDGNSQITCSIEDQADGSLDQPALSHGPVSTNSSLYKETKRME